MIDDKYKKTIEVLEAIQLSYYEDYNLHNDNDNISYKQKVETAIEYNSKLLFYKNKLSTSQIEKMIHDIFSDDKDVLTKYQPKDLGLYYKYMFEKLRDAADYLFGFKKFNIPIYGTVYSLGFHAHVMKEKESYPFIVISRGVRFFAISICKIVALAYQIHEIPGGGIDIVLNEKIILHNIKNRGLDGAFLLLFFHRILFGKCHIINLQSPSAHYDELMLILFHSYDCFTLAHEYAHCILGHLDFNIGKDQWLMENEADFCAMYLTIKAFGNEVDQTFLILGIYIFLKVLETIEKIRLEMIEKKCNSRHPPIAQRIETLYDFLIFCKIPYDELDFKLIDLLFDRLYICFYDNVICHIKKQINELSKQEADKAYKDLENGLNFYT